MNIRDVWPTILPEELASPRALAFQEMLEMRKLAYQGFAELETDRGFLTPTASISHSKGQEMVRILICRGIEEWLEAMDAEDPDHVMEEVIDSVNYIFSIAILDPNIRISTLCLFNLASQWQSAKHRYSTVQERVHSHFVQLCQMGFFPVLESLRNRAWQHNAQSPYYDGLNALENMLGILNECVLEVFPDWETFAQFYLAKHRVLMFRLKSQY